MHEARVMKLGFVLAIALGLGCAATVGCGSSGVGEFPGVAGGGPAKAVPSHGDAGTAKSGTGSSGGTTSGSSSGGSTGDSGADGGTTPFGSVDVASFTLIDATTGNPITGFDPITYGATIDLGIVGSQLSMLVTPPPVAAVGSMAFALDATFTYTADTSPYSLCGKDANGSYNPCPLAVGPHTLTVTTYPEADLGGAPYQPPTVFEFTVVNSASDAGTD